MNNPSVILCKTADEFLNTLSLCNPLWWDKNNECHWIYRGQEAYCPLIPSLYRKNNNNQLAYQNIFDKNKNKFIKTVPDLSSTINNLVSNESYKLEENYKNRLIEIIKSCFVEIALTDQFLLKCNEIRLPTPTLKLFQNQYPDTSAVEFFYNQLTEFIKNFLRQYKYHAEQSYFLSKNFIPFEFPEAMALARHHRVLSRLLDWSNDPLIAAYFSTLNCNSEKICVWALSKRYLNQNPKQGQIVFYEKLSKTGLEFLYIQKGLFTHMIGVEEYFFKYGKWPTLDEFFLSTYTNDIQLIQKENYFKKICLSSSDIPILLKKLNRMGINKFNLMPTYDNVGESIDN